MNESTSKSNRTMWAALIVVAMASTATAFYWLSGDNGLQREFASGDADRVRAALTSAEREDMDTETRKIAADAMRNMSTEEMMKLMDRDDISEEDRRQLRRNMRTVWMGEMSDRAEEYFAAETEEEKNAVLDKQIDQFQKFRERMEEMRKQREDEGEDEDDEEAQKEREDRRRNRPVQSTDQKKERMAARSPEQSAKMMNMFMAMRNRASQRGIEMGFGRGGGGRGGPGRGGRGGSGGGGRGGSSGR